MACTNAPENGDQVMIRKQVSETHRVRDLADLISNKPSKNSLSRESRKEAAKNDLEVENNSFLSLGLKSTYLELGIVEEVYDIAKKYSTRAN